MRMVEKIRSFFADIQVKSRTLNYAHNINENKWMRVIIGVVLLILLVLMFPRGRSLQFADMNEGSISTRRIVAPFNFEILKTTEEYQRDRNLAVQKVLRVFTLETNKIDQVLEQVDVFFNVVKNMRRNLLVNPRFKEAMRDSLFQWYTISVLDSHYKDLLIDPRGKIKIRELQAFHDEINRIVRDLMSVGIINVEKKNIESPNRRFVINDNNGETVHSFDDYYDINEAREKAAKTLNETYSDKAYLAQLGYGLIVYFLRPNYIYDEAIHQQRIDDALARVPLSSGFVSENEKIVDRNERITPEIRKKLISLATKMAEKSMQEGGIQRVFPFLGASIFVLVLFSVFIAFIYSDHKFLLAENKLVLLVALVFLLVSSTAFFIHRLELSEYLVPVVLGSMLLTSLFDTRVGLAGTVVMSVLVGGLWGNEFNLAAVSLFIGVTGVLTIHRVRGRRQLIQAIFIIGGANVLAITFMGLLRLVPFSQILRQWPYGAFAGFLIPIITYGLLPLIESLFDITTDFSLLELSNLNHPLLKRLSVQAPGTYHHSIIVGNLSEAAAQAVEANSLLARVGSYYHDVGKMEKSEYFVENQIGERNPHEKLTPRMSALILMNHVKKGLELAEKYRIPTSVKNIIQQHQGTTVMTFFYRKAVNKDGTSEVSEEDYRYPGPRPQSKEAAIVMLADVVEAATRTLKDPTHSRLKGLIEELVDGRFQEGQLNESPLTLRDLERIKESFLTILAGTFHTRVEYPEKKEETN